MTAKRALPIGIQTFREIREEDFYYVDKTSLALRLIAEGKYYFLSRPRRFGKSLFLDTLAELFEGNAALFNGLAAEQRWDWSRRYPVIRLSFAEGVLADRQALDRRIADLIRINRDALGLSLYPDLDIPGLFGELIRQAHAHFGERVVVLVDEYDKPILAQPLKQQRLHIRLDANAKQKLERAAVYANRTLSEFVLSRALDAADAVILEHETLRLSNADWQVFLDALDNPPEPNPRLRQAFTEHAKRVRQ